ncbi:MAG: 3'-5' exonuclease [Rhodospirillales bacterium]|nr:3'-5' exonuclease [Rhodospirillales bacterium]
MILIYDTETTSLVDFKSPSDAPHQPHIVQFAAILVDPVTRIERASIDLIVKPDGWTIPDDVAAIRGITNEIAMACGVPELTVANLFLALRAKATREVAHNSGFDRRIMRIAMLRHGMTREEVEASEAGQNFCTMKAAQPIVNLPPTDRMLAAGFKGPKQPKLAECISHFFNEELTGAHNALVDVRACARLYFHLQDLMVAA